MCFKKKLVIPYPEESVDYSQTIDNTSITSVRDKFLVSYIVPISYHAYWRNEVTFILSTYYQYPACTSAETKQIWVRPEWCSQGVLAHEACHIIYPIIPPGFEYDFNSELKKGSLLKYVYDNKENMRHNIIESHADCYRYLGYQMPSKLHKYYPLLM